MASSVSLIGSVIIAGDVYNDKTKNSNMSAIDMVDDWMILGADEGNKVKLLKRTGDRYDVVQSLQLNSDEEEIDIEGIGSEDGWVYVVGSHAYKRKRVKDKQSYEENREAIATVLLDPQRDQVFRFSLTSENPDRDLQRTSLRSIIESHPILQRFSRIPSKENGVDIEGIAVRDGLLYLGFRGPVLRDNWVPILTCSFAQPITHADLLFVNLHGRGVRDLTRVQDGFLILAGAVSDGVMTYRLYLWDGKDCLPGSRKKGKAGRCDYLGDIPADPDQKVEGLALLREDKTAYEVVVVYDGSPNGNPTQWRVTK